MAEVQKGSNIGAEIRDGGKSPFLDLPAELRLNIYSMLRGTAKLEMAMVLKPDRTRTGSLLVPSPMMFREMSIFPSILALMRACKTLNTEAREFLYNNTEFTIEVIPYMGGYYAPKQNVHVLRFLRTVKLQLYYSTAHHGRTTQERDLFFKNCRAIVHYLDSSDQLQKFSMYVELNLSHINNDFRQELLPEFQRMTDRLAVADLDNLAGARTVLAKMKEVAVKDFEQVYSESAQR